MKSARFSSAKLAKSAFLLLLLVILVFSFRLVFAADNSLPTGNAQHWLFPLEMGVLLGVLVTLCFAMVLENRDEPTKERPVWFFPLMAGLLGLACMITAYTHLGIWPTGVKTGMIVDMHHQYAPLLSQLRDMLIHGGNPLYSFEVGLGASFLPLFGYYLASPLNFLLVFFPDALLAEGILVITLIKNALCAAFFAAMVQYLFGKRDFSVCIVSLMYSLMMYLLAYSWNIMWLDCLMVLPLIILGFERLMRTGRYTLYVLALAYALYANYYIGFMVCVFLVLYYIAYILRTKHTLGRMGRSTVRFGVGSLLGGGLAMFLLLPVYFSLSATSAAGGDLPSEFSANFPALGVLEQLLYGATPTIRSGNLPNLYCGMLAVFLLPIYFTIHAIPLRRRLTMGALLAVMAFSTTLNIPDLIWHGLHAPNDLPYRFSFLVSFVLLLITFEALQYWKEIRPRQLALSAVGIAAFLFLLEKLNAVEELTGAEKAGNLPFASVYVSLLLVAIYAAIMLLAHHKAVAQRTGTALLLLAVTVEMTLGACGTLDTLNQNEYFTAHDNYVDNVDTAAIRLAVKKTEQLAAKDTEGGFYRMEFLPRRTCVDTALFDYRGITTFASSNTYETTRMMGSLGYAINGVNSYLYRSFVAPSDSLLGIRYVILESDIRSHRQLKQLDSVTASYVNEYSETETKTLYIYENTTALSLAYVVNSDVKNFVYDYYSPFESQNDLYNAMTGEWEELYTFCDLEADDDAGYTSGVCSFTLSGGGTASFTATVEEAGQYFIFGDCRAAESISVSAGSNSWDITPHEPYIIDAGSLAVDTEVTFTVSSDSTASGNLYVARLDTALFEQYNRQFAAAGMDITTFSDTRIEGSLNAAAAGSVMTSIVYDEGWTVLVDGNPVETFAIGKGFIGFDVPAGSHTVTMTFFPKGLKIGLIISGVSLLLLIALVLLRRRADLYREALAAKETEESAATQPEAGAPETSPEETPDVPLPVEDTAPAEEGSAEAKTPPETEIPADPT